MDYEEDLDLLVVTCVAQSGDSYQATVCLYDNQTSHKLQEIVLNDPWEEVGYYVICHTYSSGGLIWGPIYITFVLSKSTDMARSYISDLRFNPDCFFFATFN